MKGHARTLRLLPLCLVVVACTSDLTLAVEPSTLPSSGSQAPTSGANGDTSTGTGGAGGTPASGGGADHVAGTPGALTPGACSPPCNAESTCYDGGCVELDDLCEHAGLCTGGTHSR